MTHFLIKKSDEGTNSKFTTRMFLGVIELRNHLEMTNNDPRNIQINKDRFDQLYDPIRNSLEIALLSCRKLNSVCNRLINDGLEGKLITSHSGNSFELIDNQFPIIQKEFLSVVSNSSIAIKNHLQVLLKEVYSFDIGGLFTNDKDFNNKFINNLSNNGQSQIVDYFVFVRSWSNQLINEIWNESKHSNWNLEPTKFDTTYKPRVFVDLPLVKEVPINIYAYQILNRSCVLVEDMLVHGFNFYRNSPILFLEIDNKFRSDHQNRRFQPSPKLSGMVIPIPFFKDTIEII